MNKNELKTMIVQAVATEIDTQIIRPEDRGDRLIAAAFGAVPELSREDALTLIIELVESGLLRAELDRSSASGQVFLYHGIDGITTRGRRWLDNPEF